MESMGVKLRPTLRLFLKKQLLDKLKKLFQIPLMSFTPSTNFFPREDASEFFSVGLTVLRTPLSHCPLNDR